MRFTSIFGLETSLLMNWCILSRKFTWYITDQSNVKSLTTLWFYSKLFSCYHFSFFFCKLVQFQVFWQVYLFFLVLIFYIKHSSTIASAQVIQPLKCYKLYPTPLQVVWLLKCYKSFPTLFPVLMTLKC